MIAFIVLIDVVLALAGLLLMWLCTRPEGRSTAAVPKPRRAAPPPVGVRDQNRSLFVARPPATAVTVGGILASRSTESGPFVVA